MQTDRIKTLKEELKELHGDFKLTRDKKPTKNSFYFAIVISNIFNHQI